MGSAIAIRFSARLAPAFAAFARPKRPEGAIVWEPALYAHLRLRFDAGTEVLEDRDEHRLWFPLGETLGEPTEPPCQSGQLYEYFFLCMGNRH